MSLLTRTRVLLLDDDRITVDTLAAMLNQNGYESRTVYDHQAVVVTGRDFRPDVFITGVENCCEKNGFETAIDILSFLPACHVSIFSGQAAAADTLIEYRRIGYEFEVFAKPIHPQDLLHKLSGLQVPRSRKNSGGEWA
jgi:DNA-binding NtrC family response regulator